MENSPQTMITLLVGAVLWLIILIMVLRNEFHNKKVKKVWVIVLILFPPSCLLFPFIGMKHLK